MRNVGNDSCPIVGHSGGARCVIPARAGGDRAPFVARGFRSSSRPAAATISSRPA